MKLKNLHVCVVSACMHVHMHTHVLFLFKFYSKFSENEFGNSSVCTSSLSSFRAFTSSKYRQMLMQELLNGFQPKTLAKSIHALE